MDSWRKITTRSDEGAYLGFSPFIDEHSGYSYNSKKRKSMGKLIHIVSPLLRRRTLFHPIKRKMKKLKIRDYTQSSSTTMSLGEEDSVFTSSTIVSTSSSIPRATEMTKTVLLSPNHQLLKVKTEGSRMENPFAKPSKHIKKSGGKMEIIGDRDVWEERVCVHSKTGKQKSFFYSLNTGFRVKDEPPTGASEVIFLDK